MTEKRTPNPFVTEEQERLRELVFAMWSEERELGQADHRMLQAFVKVVREEHVEDNTPGHRSIRRVSYYMLNDRGRKLYELWQAGELDKLVPDPRGVARPE